MGRGIVVFQRLRTITRHVVPSGWVDGYGQEPIAQPRLISLGGAGGALYPDRLGRAE